MMESMKFVARLMLLIPCIQGQTASVGQIKVEREGQSGKIKFFLDGEIDKPPVFMIFESLKELDDQGNVIGDAGREKHSFNSLPKHVFTFYEEQIGVIPYSNISSSFFTFEIQLRGLTSLISVGIYIAMEGGEIRLDNDIQELHRGQIKVFIDLSNWTWCGCKHGQQNQVGSFVDLEISIQSRENSVSKQDSSSGLDRYSFGNVSVDLSNKVQVDDAWQDMASGYPKVESKRNKQSLTFRFPRFTTKAFYHLTLSLDDMDKLAEDANTVSGAAMLTLSLAQLIPLLAMFT